jgi:hypothetical protein
MAKKLQILDCAQQPHIDIHSNNLHYNNKC